MSARSDARLAPALQALGIKNTTNMSGTAKIAIEAHAAGPRLDDVVAAVTIEAAEVSVDDLALSQQAPTRLRFDRGRLEVGDTRLEGTSLVPHGLGRDRSSARHRRRVAGRRVHVPGVSPR